MVRRQTSLGSLKDVPCVKVFSRFECREDSEVGKKRDERIEIREGQNRAIDSDKKGRRKVWRKVSFLLCGGFSSGCGLQG